MRNVRGRGFTRPHDLRLLPNVAQLGAWWNAARNVNMSSTLLSVGSGAPVVTVSGPLTETSGVGLYVQVNSTNSALFDWNNANGGGLSRGVGQTGVTLPQGGSFLLPDGSGRSINFPVGIYNNSHSWQAVSESWGALHGGPTMLLDNSSVYAAKGPVIESPSIGWCGLNPSLGFSPSLGTGGLGNTSGVPSFFAGDNQPFHIFMALQPTSLHISTLPVAAFGANSSSSTTGNYLDARWYGPDATTGPDGVGAQWFMQRRTTGTAVQLAKLSDITLGPAIIDWAGDGANGYVNIGGQQVISAPWTSSGTLACNRWLLMAQKLGGNAVSNIAYGRINAVAIYTQKQTESWGAAWSVRTAMAAGINP
jgi:hypothetical protein